MCEASNYNYYYAVHFYSNTPKFIYPIYLITNTQAIPPPLMQLYSIGANQTVINSVYPKLVPLINTANKLPHDPIDIFTWMGGSANWTKTFPSSCSLTTAKTYKPCAWWCDAQSCDQCHPNNNGYTHMAAGMAKGIGL